PQSAIVWKKHLHIHVDLHLLVFSSVTHFIGIAGTSAVSAETRDHNKLPRLFYSVGKATAINIKYTID
ncbi:MAG TPA: hypothetical protein VKR53_16765, partial [Puia sp.]|nr:hypothetical protein [Puia sp.]